MTPQEDNIRIQQQVNEELRAYMEAQRAATIETEKSAAVEAKVAGLTTSALQIMEKLMAAQLRYTIAMAEGKNGAAVFNDSIDAAAEAAQMAAVALSLLVPGGPLIKGLVAGFTFLATQSIKVAAEMQKAANLQADATYKAFSAFSKAGATGADGLKGFFKDVQRMRLNVRELDQLAGALAASAQEMSTMGGTVYKARAQFADLNQGLRKYEQGFLRLGLSNEETAEASLGFMKLQNTLTMGQQRDYGKLSGAAKKYIEEQETLTRVTGFNRKQQEAAQEKFLSQERFGAKLAQLEREGTVESQAMAKRLTSDMMKAAAVSDEFAQAFADSVTQMYTSEASVKGLTSTQGTLGAYLNDVLDGRIKTEEESNAGFQNIFSKMKETQEMFEGSQLAGATEGFLFNMKTFQKAIQTSNNGFAVQMADAKTEVDKLAGTIAGVDEALTAYTGMLISNTNKMLALQKELDGKFSTEVAGSPIMDYLQKLVMSMQPTIDLFYKLGEILLPGLVGTVDLVVKALNVVSLLLLGDFVGAFNETIDGIWNFAMGWGKTVELLVQGLFDMIDGFAKQLERGVKSLFAPLITIFDDAGTVISGFADGVKEGIGKFSDALVNMVAKLWERLSALIPDLGAVKDAAGSAVNYVSGAASSAGNYVSSFFGGSSSTAPAGAASSASSTAPTSAPAPQGGKPASSTAPTSAPAPQGGKPPAPAPQGGKPPAPAPAPAPAPPPPPPTGQPNSFNPSKLLNYLGQKEAQGRYDMLVGGKTKSDLTSMTVAEVLDFQKTMISLGHESTALGKYQIKKSTMQGLVKNGDLALTDIFNSSTQDRAAMALLKGRGMNAYISGKISKDEFADRVAKEWASMPLASGVSAHAGVGSNKASGSREQYLAAFARDGGVFDGPKSGYAATLHGMEAVIPLKDGAVPVSMSQEFNMTATNLGELVNIMKNNVDMQASMLAVLDEIRRVQTTTADNTGRMAAYASN